MTLLLLDTNAYLRIAKRIKPLLGVKFGQKEYTATILKIVEDEVHRSPKLRYYFPWFDDAEIAAERLAKQVRLSKDEKQQIGAAQSVLRNHVLENINTYKNAPPSLPDCYILAFGQIRPAIVVTDDLGMHRLADDFEIPVLHGHDLLKKMLTAKLIDRVLIVEIYEALELNDDLPRTWLQVKHTSFKKIFGPKK